MEVDPRLFPISLDRALRYAAHRGDFSKRKPAEEFQVDDLCKPRIHLGQLVDRIADALQVVFVGRAINDRRRRGDLEHAATLHGTATTGVIDDEAAHHPCRIRHESRAVGKHDAFTARDVEVRLMEQRRRAESDIPVPPCQLALSQPVQFGVQQLKIALPRRQGSPLWADAINEAIVD